MRDLPCYSECLQQWKAHTGRFVRNPYLSNPEIYFDKPGFRDHIYLNNKRFAALMKVGFSEPFTETRYCDGLLHNRMMNEMFNEGTRVILHEDDLNSMRYSVENRSPYLDSRLFDFSYSIPTEYLIKDGYGKYILRRAMEGILNDNVRLDRRKKGFNASLTSLVDFQDKDTRAYVLDNSPVYEMVDREKLEGIIDTQPMPNSLSKFLFSFLNVKIFLEQHV